MLVSNFLIYEEIMPEPKIAQKEPICVELTDGKKYHWCTCGESATQPFCDGKHKEAGQFKSLHFEVLEPKKAWLCACKHSKNAPYCDGTHKTL